MSTYDTPLNSLLRLFGRDVSIRRRPEFADGEQLGKATLFLERYREIVSDPLNVLIDRVPNAGYVDKGGNVTLHNGTRVPLKGKLAYYEDFSDVLVINRGVHEPLEEFCFQQVLRKITAQRPVMLELGAYWAHYSMWFKKTFTESRCFMVEPDAISIKCGQNNFAQNGFSGEFINQFVSNEGLQVDDFLKERGLERLSILHSDIQGYEVEMIKGAEKSLAEKVIDYVFISTHSEEIYQTVISQCSQLSYRIEVSSPFACHTTSHDGFILATNPDIEPVFANFAPLGRHDIAHAKPEDLVKSICNFT
jgi:hypothetical protein